MARRKHEEIPEVLVIFCLFFVFCFFIWMSVSWVCSVCENFELDTYMTFSVYILYFNIK